MFIFKTIFFEPTRALASKRSSLVLIGRCLKWTQTLIRRTRRKKNKKATTGSTIEKPEIDSNRYQKKKRDGCYLTGPSSSLRLCKTYNSCGQLIIVITQLVVLIILCLAIMTDLKVTAESRG